MTWMQAWLRAGIIFLYFVVSIVIIPDFVIGLGPIAEASTFIRDGVVGAVWAGGFVAGLWGLRMLQSQGRI